MPILGPFWVQKILPLVYDNSLSYYEVLCKMAKAIDDLYEELGNNFSKILKKFFNDIMPSVMYEEENERIVFSFTITSAIEDGIHVYTQNDETMSIYGED